MVVAVDMLVELWGRTRACGRRRSTDDRLYTCRGVVESRRFAIGALSCQGRIHLRDANFQREPMIIRRSELE